MNVRALRFRALVIGLLVVLVTTSMIMVACSAKGPDGAKSTRIDIGGGSIGGSANQVANAYAGLLDHFMKWDSTVLTYPITQTAVAVSQHEVAVGVSNSTDSWDPWNGSGTWAGKPALKNLREVHPRSASALLVYVKVDSPIRTFRDLIGKRISPGTKAMGAESLMSRGAPVIGLDWQKDFDVQYMGHVEGGAALVAGKIAAVVETAAPPNPTMLQVDVTTPLRVVGLSDAEATALAAVLPGAVKVSLPPNWYHMDVPITTVGYVTHTLAASDGGKDDVVYALAKLVVEHPEFVGYYSASFKSFLEDKGPGGFKDFLTKWPSYTSIPLHEAAVRYYREIGWTIPEGRLPPEMKGKK